MYIEKASTSKGAPTSIARTTTETQVTGTPKEKTEMLKIRGVVYKITSESKTHTHTHTFLECILVTH